MGYTLFSDFIMSLKDIVSNPYIYRGGGMVIGIVLSVLPVLIGVSLYRLTDIKVFDLLAVFYLPTLLLPGIEGFGSFTPYLHPLILYMLSFLCYSVMTYLCFQRFQRLEYQNEK